MAKQIQLFGTLNFEDRALNLIILLCRFYMYKTKILKKQLQKYKTLEKYISMKNSKEQTFNQKWRQYRQYSSFLNY